MKEKLSHSKEAWLMNKVISSLNNEEAYYGSGWLYIWPDECSYEECEDYFSDEESFDELHNLYLRVFKRYYKDGFYNHGYIDKDFLDYVKETMTKLNIEGEPKETKEKVWSIVSEELKIENENEIVEDEDTTSDNVMKKINDSDVDFIEAEDEDGNPFLILYEWKDVQDIQKVIKPDFEPKDEYDTSVLDSMKNIDWGFADEWSKCDECDKLIRTSPDSYSFVPDYWLSDEHGLLCGDCVRDNHALEYAQTMINEPRQANTILGENELEELGFTLIDKDFENGWYDRHDSPEEILETALEKHPEGAFLFSISGVSQFATQFELWGADIEEKDEEEIEIDESLKINESKKRYIVKMTGVSKKDEQEMGITGIVLSYEFDAEDENDAKRQAKAFDPRKRILSVELKTKERFTEADEEVDSEIDADSIQVYQFPNEFKNYLPEFKRLCKEHDLKYLGKGKNIIDDVKEPDFFVEGRYADLVSLADEFDYQLHPDYLCSADSFASEDILITKQESIKEAVEDNKKGFTKEEAQKFSKELTQKFFDDGGYYDIWSSENEIQAQIEWGDWKHDHLYFKSKVTQFFKDLEIDINIESEVTEEDDSDTYSALHTITKA